MQKNNLQYYLGGMIHEGDLDSTVTKYELGQGFKMIDGEGSEEGTTLFPIYFEDEIMSILYVRKTDNEYSGNLSSNLVEEIKDILNNNVIDENNPFKFYAEDGNIYSSLNGQKTLIFTFHVTTASDDELNVESVLFSQKNENKVIDDDEILTVVNQEDSISFETEGMTPKITSRGVVIDKFNYRIHPWNVKAVQDSRPWCAAFAAANILNNKNDARSTTAEDIARYLGVGTNKGMSDNQIIQYANSRGVYPYKVGRPMTWTEIQNEARKSNAIWGAWRGTGNMNGFYHAIDVVGTYYDAMFDKKCYWVSNPWYANLEIIAADKSQIVYNIPGGSFIWERSITNW
ncbi:C47 family peptidase [Enterococcus sp. HY326]|uniref:C47 family peptidase n=1 Tax=Enterococcus sp. HY326 TaxID=2971265 RepID=UPI002240377A|nr:C47 family peptidase [Enterococcus sp. HY326]